MKRILYTLIILLLFNHTSVDSQNLPIWLTHDEKIILNEEYFSSREDQISSVEFTAPPSSAVRTMAEWEEIQALVITWTSYPTVLREIVKHAKLECEVIIICSNENTVRNYLSSYGIDDTNITFLERPYDSIWMRDYGGNTVYTNDIDSLILIDWIYNRPRPNDDVLPQTIAEHFDIPLYSTTVAPSDLVHTGGNFMADGLGIAFSSNLVLEENEPGNPYGVTTKTEEDIDQIMNDFMGIDEYIKMPVLPYDGIHHIDMHMKLLDEETLLIGEYPQGVADGPQIEANLQYVLNNFNSSFGTPFKIRRIQMPPDNGLYPNNWLADYRTYTNSVFVNKTILVPIYEEQFDTTALRIMEEELPGYKVIGIDCNSIIQSGGALHCITRAVGVSDPLLIVHQALEDREQDNNDYFIEATIQHKSGIQTASVFYTTDLNLGYQSVPMSFTNNNTWTALIPNQASGSVIHYYIHAEANSGKTMNRPMPAPEGYWKFKINGLTSTFEIQNEGVKLQMNEIFPNPSNSITCIPIHTNKNLKQVSIELFDVYGKLINTIHQGEMSVGDNNFFIFANKYASGTYFVRLKYNEGITSRKLIIK